MTCPACLSRSTAPAISVEGWQFQRCRECLSLFVPDPPAPDETAQLYRGADYFVDEEYGPTGGGTYLGYKDYLADRPHVEQKFAECLEHLERHVEPGRLLDVGAGPGFLLSVAKRRGWEARGIDLNPWAASYAREQVGVQVEVASLEESALPDAGFDAVTLMDLVEHVARPDELIAEVARITRPGGALAILTPDAGSPVSRALGSHWPEVKRVPEHLVLFSATGLARLLERHGWLPVGWHWIGKTSSLETLVADVSPAAPGLSRAVAPLVTGSRLGRFTFELDPRSKFCLYAVRSDATADGAASGAMPRLPKRLPRERSTEEAIVEELESLARANRLCDWMFEQFADRVRGRVVEVGAGIGTFSDRLLAAGARELVLIEPENRCSTILERKYAGDSRVSVARDELPDSPALAQGGFDFALCQNVLEHIADDSAAVRAMADALTPGGQLGLLVPAGPRLYGTLDAAYGHHRRYTPQLLRARIEAAGLVLENIHHFNLLGIPGWWLKNRTGSAKIGPLALSAYESLLRPWRQVERLRPPPLGLSLIAHAAKPRAS